MKPFTTVESLTDGTRYLPAQLEGLQVLHLLELLRGAELRRCYVPVGQCSELAWSARLEFSSGCSLEITSSSTLVSGWAEHGTINIALTANVLDDVEQVNLSALVGFVVDQISIVQWQAEGMVVDAGIELRSTQGEVLSAVAVDIPGAFLISIPGDAVPAVWQFPADEYVRVDIGVLVATYGACLS